MLHLRSRDNLGSLFQLRHLNWMLFWLRILGAHAIVIVIVIVLFFFVFTFNFLQRVGFELKQGTKRLEIYEASK